MGRVLSPPWDTPIPLASLHCCCQKGCLQRLQILLSNVSKADLNSLLHSLWYNGGRQEWSAGSQITEENELQAALNHLTFWVIRYLLPTSSLGLPVGCFPALPPLPRTFLRQGQMFSHLLSSLFGCINILAKDGELRTSSASYFLPISTLPYKYKSSFSVRESVSSSISKTGEDWISLGWWCFSFPMYVNLVSSPNEQALLNMVGQAQTSQKGHLSVPQFPIWETDIYQYPLDCSEDYRENS